MKESVICSLIGKMRLAFFPLTCWGGIIFLLISCQNEQVTKYDNDDKALPENIKGVKGIPQVFQQDTQGKKEPSVKQSAGIERNIFLSEYEEEYYAGEYREEVTYLNLSAVFYSNDVSYAVINGRVVKKSDILDNKEVVDIAGEKVTLKDSQGKEYIVKMGEFVK